MSNEITKEYANGEITVLWKPMACVHSANCVKGLPVVFNSKEKPWIKMDGATSKEIIDQVSKCPSGAISIKGDEDQTQKVGVKEVKVAAKSPMLLELEVEKTYAWCACGHSANQPWCDGSHKITSIKPVIFKVEESKKAALCMCKHSANQPFCDGTHNSVLHL